MVYGPIWGDGLCRSSDTFSNFQLCHDLPRPGHQRARLLPLVRFGMPAIGFISTEAIAGELHGGAYLGEVAGDFGLDIDAVRWAQSYELSQRAAA